MKNVLKMVGLHFFIITTLVLFVDGIGHILEGAKTIRVYEPFVILGVGFISALPSLLFYFKKEPSKLQFVLRFVFHFIIVEAVVLTSGYYVRWYSDLISGVVMFFTILAIYLFVCIFTFINGKSTANSINEALDKIRDEE